MPDAGPPPLPVDQPDELAESLHFPLGVASGDVTASSAVLWTRYAGGRALELRVWDGQGDVSTRLAQLAVSPSAGGFVNWVVEGLLPGARYRFGFLELENGEVTGRSPIGIFRAAPALDSLDVVTLGAVSCTKQGRNIGALSRASERTDLDAFLLLGDTSYNDGAKTLEEYRQAWASSLGRGDYRALRASTSVIATWDDHEVDNGWNPETIGDAQRDAAFTTFFESLPVRRSNESANRIWRSLRFGQTVELFVLDTRSERTPSDKALYLSRAQMDWLKAGLSQSTAVFKLVMNSVPIGDFPFFTTFSDGWMQYPDARSELLQHISDAQLKGVLFVSGDFHFASLGRVARSGLGSDLLEVLAGPGGQASNPAHNTLVEPQFDWTSGENNYAALRFEPMDRRVTISYVNDQGATFEERSYTL